MNDAQQMFRAAFGAARAAVRDTADEVGPWRSPMSAAFDATRPFARGPRADVVGAAVRAAEMSRSRRLRRAVRPPLRAETALRLGLLTVVTVRLGGGR